MTKSLWPDKIEFSDKEKPPVSILREQATYLGEKTQNLVTAEVASVAGDIDNSLYDAVQSLAATAMGSQKRTLKKDYFYDIFYLVAPALNNYRFELFITVRKIDQFYPIEIRSDTLDIDWRELNSQDELLTELGNIFSHPKTIKIIESMLVQSGWPYQEKVAS
ncbi:MAG TPA: hypothetical protein VGD99_24870 [Anaerolineae bacterium]|jgi:hypothetical protein